MPSGRSVANARLRLRVLLRHGPAGLSAWVSCLMVSCLIVHVFLGWCPLCLVSLHGGPVCLAVRLLLMLDGLHESCIVVLAGLHAWLILMVTCLIVHVFLGWCP